MTMPKTNHLSYHQNTFAGTLGGLGLNSYAMLVVDLLHEFELGVWKAVFKHLIHLLYAVAPAGCPQNWITSKVNLIGCVLELIYIPFVGSDWSLHLGIVQLDDSAPTHLKWKNLWHGTIRTSFRWVVPWWLNQTWLAYLLTVHYTCILRTTTWAPWFYHYQAALLSHWMACTGQVKVPHRTHNTLPQFHYNNGWKAAL